TNKTHISCWCYDVTASALTTYTTSGNYYFISAGANVSSTTLFLYLSINNGVHTTQTQTSCGSYTWTAGTGTTYTTSGNYDFISTGANGCADTVTLQLTINNGRHTTQTQTSCGSYTWTAGTGMTYTTSGNYDFISTGANGCADTVTLQLTINNGTHTTQTQTSCGSYTWTAGTGLTYTTSGNYDFISTGANGCADTVTLQLTINNGVHTTQTQTSCGSYTWTAGTGTTYTTSGNYDFISTGANGCADTVTLQLTINI